MEILFSVETAQIQSIFDDVIVELLVISIHQVRDVKKGQNISSVGILTNEFQSLSVLVDALHNSHLDIPVSFLFHYSY